MTDIELATLTHFGDAPFFVFCDHASNVIPADLHCLGLPDDFLKTHIAWDIGAGPLTTAIAEKLHGVAFNCGYSRLIIDANRSPTAKDFIPAVSDQIPVPGNQMLSEKDRQDRMARFHEPYHEQLSAAIDRMIKIHGDPFMVCVHSFTNRLMGAAEDRPWRIGMLWNTDEESARVMIDSLERATGWSIGDNTPYDAREFNYSIDRHISPLGLRHVTLEVRQDMLVDEHAVVDMASLLVPAIRETAARAFAQRAAS